MSRFTPPFIASPAKHAFQNCRQRQLTCPAQSGKIIVFPANLHHGTKIEMKHTISTFANILAEEQGQDIAEYAVMLAVILVIVVGTIRLIGSNANTVFSQVASSVQ